MTTLIVKGTSFSYNDISLMKSSDIKDVKVILIQPSGNTETIVTSRNTFNICNDLGLESIIYGL